MSARDVASGKNHHHERRTDGERRNHARTRANSRAANCQDKEKRSDEFRDIFVHKFNVVSESG
jgi:hypothetical protein